MDIHQQKEELRGQLLKLRKSLSEQEFRDRSRKIVARLQSLPEFTNASTIHCYVSMNDRREVDTHTLIRQMLQTDKEVVVPITQFEDGTLRHVKLDSFDDLRENKWGVLEPEDNQQVPLDELDVVIVPMVAGDMDCNRMGYGKGFYDRFLKDVACPKIGLLFEQNILDQLPVEEFDIALDNIVTEQRVIRRD